MPPWNHLAAARPWGLPSVVADPPTLFAAPKRGRWFECAQFLSKGPSLRTETGKTAPTRADNTAPLTLAAYWLGPTHAAAAVTKSDANTWATDNFAAPLGLPRLYAYDDVPHGGFSAGVSPAYAQCSRV